MKRRAQKRAWKYKSLFLEPGWFVPGNERNARNPPQLSSACFEEIYLILHFLSKKGKKEKEARCHFSTAYDC